MISRQRQAKLQARTREPHSNFITRLLLIWLLSVLLPIPSWATRLLVNPEGPDLYFVQQRLAHTQPPFDTLAELDSDVKAAYEFHRKDAFSKALDRLRAKDKGVEDVQEVVVNLNAMFSEYDSKYKEYDFDINDGSYISYNNVFGRELRLALTNGSVA